jgi:hypothetical protein
VAGGSRKLNIEGFYDLLFLINIIRVIKSRSMKWGGGLVALWWRRKMRNEWGNLKEGDQYIKTEAKMEYYS